MATTDTEIATQNYSEYVRYRDTGNHGNYVERAKRNNNYYLGEQWDPADKQKLADVGRPALTINLCLNKINTVAGEQISKRADVSFKPRGNGATDEVAKDLNSLFESIFEENQFEWLESGMFMDGIIEERGFLDLSLDFTEHMAGEARFTPRDNRDILIDPDGQDYDPDTWAGFIHTRLYSLDDIEAEFGAKKRVQMEALGESGTNYPIDSMFFSKDNTFGGENRAAAMPNAAHGEKVRSIRFVRVISRQYFKMAMAWHFIDMETGDMKMAPKQWGDERVQAFAAKNQLGLMKKMAKMVRKTVSADHILLHDDWSPFRHLSIVPYFCYFRRGKSSSVMTNLISPQDNLNKLSSQILHVVNSVANSGWVVEEDSLVGMDVDDLEANGAKTGLVIQYAKNSAAPAKIQPNSIPSGLDRMKMDAASQMNDISGIDDVLGGTASPEFSGVALNHQEARGMRKLMIPIDNLRRTRWILSRNLMHMIKDHYTEQRVIYITDKTKPEGENREEKVMNQRDDAGRIINDITLGDYEIIIGSRPAKDTFNEQQLSEVIEFRNLGVQIPDHWVVRYSSLEGKAELEQMLAKQAGFGEMSEEEQKAQQFEIEHQMILAQAEIEEIEAKIRDLDAKAELNEAKADDLRAGDNSSDMRKQRMTLEAKLHEKKTDQALRGRMHEQTVGAKSIDTEAKTATELEKIRTQQLSQQQQLKGR